MAKTTIAAMPKRPRADQLPIIIFKNITREAMPAVKTLAINKFQKKLLEWPKKL